MDPPTRSLNENVNDVRNEKDVRKAQVAEDGTEQRQFDVDLRNSTRYNGEIATDKDSESCRACEGTSKPATKSSVHLRNPWGNSSYADLITQAIMSSPNKSLTLQEIYAWFSDNIQYFMDKKDDPTTTGWKVRDMESSTSQLGLRLSRKLNKLMIYQQNSVRHTLSMRKRFIRVRNTEYGRLNYKSHWTINPYEQTRKSGRVQRSSGSSSIRHNNLSSPQTNDTRVAVMRNGLMYDTPLNQTPRSCCLYCEGKSILRVALSYQRDLGYYIYHLA